MLKRFFVSRWHKNPMMIFLYGVVNLRENFRFVAPTNYYNRLHWILVVIIYRPRIKNFTGNYGAYNYPKKLQSLFGQFPGIISLILLISSTGKSLQMIDVSVVAPGQRKVFMSGFSREVTALNADSSVMLYG